MIRSEEDVKKMETLSNFFSECFYSQFGIYPRIWYDVATEKHTLKAEVIRSVTNIALEIEYPKQYPKGIADRRRDRELVIYRQYYFYLCMKKTSSTLQRTGRTIGNYNHATVLHGIKCIQKILDTNDKLGMHIIKSVDLQLIRYMRENQ